MRLRINERFHLVSDGKRFLVAIDLFIDFSIPNHVIDFIQEGTG